MKKLLAFAIFTTLLVGCGSSADDVYLSCNGFSDTINVYGRNVEEKKEPLIIPVKIKKLNEGVQGLFNPPVYQIVVGHTVFENDNLFVDKEQYVGTIKRTTDSNQNQYEYRFNINRNSNHFIYYNFQFTPKSRGVENTQKTIEFEGKCEKVRGSV